MSSYTQFLPSYTVGSEAYGRISDVCRPYGKKAVVIGGKRALTAAKSEIEAALKDSDIQILGFLWYGGEASFENGDMLMLNNAVQEADMIFAVGGGKAIDCCKYVSYSLGNKPLFTFPTIASTCAAISSVAVIYYPNGLMRETYQFDKRPAKHVFINTNIIAQAPAVYLWAGIGDTIAKHFESSLASRGKELSHADALGVTMGVQTYLPLIKFGEKAMEDCKKNMPSYELEQICLCNLVTSGLVSKFVDYAYNGSLAHALFYGFTALPQIEKNHLHGEVVSYGVLVLLICDGQYDKLEELYDFYKKIKLPTKLKDIEVSFEELGPVMEKALSVGEIKHVPYEISGEMLYNSIKELEKYNEEREQ